MTTVTYSANGTYSWTCPAGVTSVLAECWGAGGSGAGGGSNYGSGGGGGGEYAAEATLAVTPGRSYTVTVGQAGAGVAHSVNGLAGGNSTFPGDSITVTAHGGGLGQTTTNGVGAGGTGSSNTTHHDGGAGGAGNASSGPGGGGGSSGGSAAGGNAGSAGSGATGGTAGGAVTGGGPGAAGGNSGGGSAANGHTPASGPGGGGGAGGQGSNGGGGGAAFDGQVQLTYTPPPPAGSATFVWTQATAGTYTWVCPAGVSSAKIECWGGGGGGGGSQSTSYGAGGGGGEYAAEAAQAVTAGSSYTVVVGAAGTAGTSGPTAGGNGGNSTFASTTVVANAGQGGGASGVSGAAGTGSSNTTHHDGGAGGTSGGKADGGGGGGSSAGPAAAGNNGTNANSSSAGAGASAVTGGGPGGNGGAQGAVGHAPGSGPGGGGGGGGGGGAVAGGAGFDGQVVITVVMPSPALFAAADTAWTFTAPSGISTVLAECWGGGGGGYKTSGATNSGGGGGGAYANSTVSVTPGSSYPFTIGAAGTGSTSGGSAGGNGGNSTFNTSSVVGAFGTGGSTSGGAAGSTGSSTGTTKYAGGQGGVGSGGNAGGGGGGGGSAGTGAGGNTGGNTASGTAGSGATAVTGGGPGGAGGASGGAGAVPGSGPGGGGGGGEINNSNGGAGYAGQVQLTWSVSGYPDAPTIQPGPTWLDRFKPNLPRPRPPAPAPAIPEPVFTSGSVALAPMALSATDAETFDAPGSVALAPMALSGTGLGGDTTSTGSVALAPMSLGAAAADLGAPDVPTIQPGLAWLRHFKPGLPKPPPFVADPGPPTTSNRTATGSVALAPMALSGTGLGGDTTSTGSVALAPMALSATDAETFAATGSVALAPMALSGTGLGGDTTSTGSVALAPMALSATDTETFAATGSVALAPMALHGTALGGNTSTSGSVALAPMALSGTGTVSRNAIVAVALPPMALSGTATVWADFPPGPLGLLFELLVGSVWTDITDYVYQRNNVTIVRGRPDETQTANPATASFTLDNRDGRFSARNPLGPYYGMIGRNSQVRISAPTTPTGQWTRGYRFWGEISEWPPSWDPTGSDVYVTITASGILRRLSQAAALRSALYRYYSVLTGTAVPLAYWPAEDGSASVQLATGIPGGFPMTWSGVAQLASDTGFSCAAALPQMNGAVFTGSTGITGSLPVASATVFTTAGTATWKAPAGINAVIAECWGAGGGGGPYNGSTGGGGGGGGEYASSSVLVTPGSTYTYVVGAGGSGNGGNSTFAGNSHTVTAHGGHGATGTGGAGGTGSSDSVHYDGGAGANGSGGPGGSASVTTTNGSQSFTSSGSWTAPSDLSSGPTVYLWGGGGGGGGQNGSGYGAGGGGGGGFSAASPSVTPGNSYNVIVGAGGQGGGGGDSTDGGNSTFAGGHTADGGSRGTASGPGYGLSGTNTYGGDGGGSGNSADGSGGGGGGSLGGNGQNGGTSYGGGAGGNGGNAGGSDTAGGSGGNGGTSGSKGGKSGSAPGGGGGGQYKTGSSGGGNGARGKVELFWQETQVGQTPDAAIGGGGGSSGGSSSAGNPGATQAGGAAVSGGGPGGGKLAGSTWTAAPSSAPGGGGGGYDSDGNQASGKVGQVRLTYAAAGTGSSNVAANVLRFLLHLPAQSTTDGAVIARMYTTGTIAYIDVVYNTGGNLTLNAYTPAAAQLFTSGEINFSADGAFLLVSVELTPSSGNIAWTLTGIQAGDSAVQATATGTLNTATLGDPYQIVMNPNGTLTDTSFGHVAVLETYDAITDLISPVAAYAGETAADRFTRLCDAENIPVTIVGTNSDSALVGPQTPEKLVTLLQECEAADRGLMYEPRDSFGLVYRTRVDLYAQNPAITLNYTNQDLSPGIQPTDDDQLTRNDVTIARPGGSSAEQALTTGSLSTADPPDGVGPYTYSETTNVDTDGQLNDLAGWVLRLGTVDEPRYPVITMDLSRIELQDNYPDIVAADIGDYLTVQNPPAWLPPGSIDQLIFGYTETLNAFVWTIAANCVPESPYEIAVAYDTGAGNGARADTDGSALHQGIGTGDTTFDVDSPSPDQPWADTTNYPAELPYDVIIGGEQMTVTAVSGTGTPQTFTVTRMVNGISKAHDVGEPVTLADPAFTAL